MLKKQLPLIIPILISVAVLWLFIFAVSRGANQPQKQEQQQQAVIFPDALISPGVTSAKNNSPTFKPSEQVSFTLNLNRKISFKLPFFTFKKAMAEEQSKNEWQGDGLKIKTNVVHTGKPVDDLTVKIEQKNTEEFTLSLADSKPDTFVPGKYTLDITLTTDKGERTITQDFSWGVLAINPNKSIYLPEETARLGIGVLNETGRTICEAKITLEVTDPTGIKTILSSENGLVQKSGQCQATSVTNVPDYLAGYKTGKAGIYKMHLEADNGNGVKSLDDAFEVRDSVPFDIERSDYPMRIYPPADYTGTITVKANQDFKGEVVETVPASFEIKQSTNYHPPAGGLTTAEGKKITWNVDFKKGEKYELSYSIKFPPISPEFYLVGPLRLRSGSSTYFDESRQWQIASDVVTTLFMDTPDATQGKEFWRSSTGGGVAGTVDYDTTQKKSGLASWKGTYTGWVSAGATLIDILPAGQAGRTSVYFRLQDFPSGFTPLIWMRTGTYDFSIGVDSSGILQVRTSGQNPGTQLGSDGSTLATGTWYRISVAWSITDTTTFTIKAFLDGTLDITANSGTVGTGPTNGVYIGWMESVSSGDKVLWFQHIYVDDDTSLTDTGDIRVTAKLPNAENTTEFDTAIGAARSATDYNNVNERPLSETNGWQDATINTPAAVENYGIQNAATGDVDISGEGTAYVARTAWVWAKAGAGTIGNTYMFNNGTEVAITLTTTSKLFTDIVGITSYPSNAAAVGMRANDNTADTYLYETGMLIAYIPPIPPKRIQFTGIKMQGIKVN